MPALSHTHTYERIRGKKDSFHCADPHCYHVIPKSRLRGKASLCTKCGKEFILTAADLQRVQPRCMDCSETKEAKQLKAAVALSGNVLGFLVDSDNNQKEIEKVGKEIPRHEY